VLLVITVVAPCRRCRPRQECHLYQMNCLPSCCPPPSPLVHPPPGLQPEPVVPFSRCCRCLPLPPTHPPPHTHPSPPTPHPPPPRSATCTR
jgi:hypothetical protein